jgi:hypothetical protein
MSVTVSVTGVKKEFVFLHLAVIQSTAQPAILLPPDHPGQQQEIEESFNKARDWLRYAPDCWIIYTSISPTVWSERLRSLKTMEDCKFLICEVNLKNKGGWLPKSAWDWMNKER